MGLEMCSARMSPPVYLDASGRGLEAYCAVFSESRWASDPFQVSQILVGHPAGSECKLGVS